MAQRVYGIVGCLMDLYGSETTQRLYYEVCYGLKFPNVHEYNIASIQTERKTKLTLRQFKVLNNKENKKASI